MDYNAAASEWEIIGHKSIDDNIKFIDVLKNQKLITLPG